MTTYHSKRQERIPTCHVCGKPLLEGLISRRVIDFPPDGTLEIYDSHWDCRMSLTEKIDLASKSESPGLKTG